VALGPSRFTRVGESPYPHEEEGIAFVRDALPNADPYQAWALFELPDPRTGRLLEVDLLVMGYGALYLVEIKSHPGRMSGDATDWWWQPPDANGRKVWVDPPFRLTNLKAKILKSRLREHVRDDRLLPYVQALVFLSHAGAINDLRADGRMGVVTRNEIRDALLKHRFPGVSPSWQNRRVTQPQVQAVARALDKLGIRPRKGKLLAGDFELREPIDEGPGYQDRKAVHGANPKLKARARTYLVPSRRAWSAASSSAARPTGSRSSSTTCASTRTSSRGRATCRTRRSGPRSSSTRSRAAGRCPRSCAPRR